MSNDLTISGLRLRDSGACLIVEVQLDGHWYAVLTERAPMQPESVTISGAQLARQIAALRCQRCRQPLNNVSPGYSKVASGFLVCTPCLQPGEEVARARGM